MTFHTIRARSAKGFIAPTVKKTRTVAIMARLETADFVRLRDMAERRRLPMAGLIRDAISHYIRRRGHE
jgi:predicted DNA-binding ribbon-helix-helix protein